VPFAFPGLDVPPGAICTQLLYSSVWGYWLVITQLTGAASDSRLKADPPGTTLQWQAAEVRGHRGWLASDRLTWYEDGQSILLVTSGGSLSPAQLLVIARNLR
jgi:hypothetical protein